VTQLIDEATTRSRTITWEDPVAAAARRAELSGLDRLQAIRDGRLPPPPIAALLDFDLTGIEAGRAVFAVTPQEFHYNPIGVVHGGLAATLIDSATGCAVETVLGPGERYTTLEVKANFVRAMTRETGRVLCEGTVVHRGRTVATAEARVVAEASGTLLAHGTATLLIIPAGGRAARDGAPTEPGR
jgi:uncharacterized protein (TIGR00369 family)